MTKFFMVVCFIYACMAGVVRSNTTGTFTYSGAESGGSSDGLVPEYHESRKKYKELIDRSYQSGKNIGIEFERPIFTINKTRLIISEKIKQSFDPKRVFNPGKMYRGV